MKYEILFAAGFKKSFSKFHDQERTLFYSKLSLFIEDHRHPSLRTRKIQGSEILFESSINMSIRVIWKYQNDNMILLIDIGHHDILKKTVVFLSHNRFKISKVN